MQRCEVCGKGFRSLNLNHLRTHGIVSWDQYQEVIDKRAKPDQSLIREVAHSLLHRQAVPEEHARKLAAINAGRNTNVGGMMAVTDMRQLLRLSRLMEMMEQMEGVALDPEKFAEYTFEQLLEMMKFTSSDIQAIIKQLSADSKKDGFGTAVENLYQYNFVQANGIPTEFDSRLPEDPRARAGLMQQVESLLGQFKKGQVPTKPESGQQGPPPVDEGLKDVDNRAATSGAGGNV